MKYYLGNNKDEDTDLLLQRRRRLLSRIGGGTGDNQGTGMVETYEPAREAYSAWKNFSPSMTAEEKQTVVNRAASGAAGRQRGAKEKIREYAAQHGLTGSGAEFAMLGKAERGARADVAGAMSDATLKNMEWEKNFGLQKARGLSDFALNTRNLDLSQARDDTQLERFYQSMLHQMGRDQVGDAFRQQAFDYQAGRDVVGDERYQDALDYQRDQDAYYLDSYENEKDFEDKLRRFLLARKLGPDWQKMLSGDYEEPKYAIRWG